MLRRIAIGLVLALLVALPAMAQDYKEGLAAAKRGDYATALKEWRPLAAKGHIESQINLGLLYHHGWGVPQDHSQAVKLFRKAAEQGDARAQTKLGYMYIKGLGVPRDHAEAIKWLRKATAKGHALAYNNYAWLLATNKDAKVRDGGKAVVLARKAVRIQRTAFTLSTLAAAHAEVGQFVEAVRVQEDALDVLRASGPKLQRLRKYQQRLKLYKNKKPYRE